MPSQFFKLAPRSLRLRTVLAVAVNFSVEISLGLMDPVGAIVIARWHRREQ